jgi:hypothetical protein
LDEHRKKRSLACPPAVDLTQMNTYGLRQLAFKTARLAMNWAAPKSKVKKMLRFAVRFEKILGAVPGTGLFLAFSYYETAYHNAGNLCLTCWDMLSGEIISQVSWADYLETSLRFNASMQPYAEIPGKCYWAVVASRNSKWYATRSPCFSRLTKYRVLVIICVDYSNRSAVTVNEISHVTISHPDHSFNFWRTYISRQCVVVLSVSPDRETPVLFGFVPLDGAAERSGLQLNAVKANLEYTVGPASCRIL